MNDEPPVSIGDLLAFAHTLADAARPIAMRYFRKPLNIETKADLSPVTIADRSIEAEMRRLINARFPAHGIYGEEFTKHIGASYTWVLDPIDGTQSFITGMPLFGTLIALMQGQEAILGIADFPALNERWAGIAGEVTRLNSQITHVSACRTIEQARLYTTTPEVFNQNDRLCFDAVSQRAALRRYGGDCYIYALLASGHCDLVIEAGLQPYDYLALVPVIEGAGGKISDWQGKPLGFDSDGRVIAAASEALWQETMGVLNS